MKKTSFILLFIFAFILISGCSGDDKPAYSDTSIQMVSYSANNMMTNGNLFLDETVSSYSSITNPIMKGVLKSLVDYTLFPYNSSTGNDFTTRMKNVYWTEDNVIQAYNLQQNLLVNDAITGGDTIVARSLSRMTAEEIKTGVNAVVKLVAPKVLKAVPFIGGVLGSLFGGPSKEEQNQEKMMAQLDSLGKSMDQMLKENRQNFQVLNAKADLTLKELEGLKGDISILNSGVEASLLNDMQNVIDQYDGFMKTFSEAANTNEARTIVYEYLKVSADYWQNILTFINTAKAVQNWAITNGQYTDKVWQDSTANVSMMYFSAFNFNYSGETNECNYDNPKKNLLMGLGNIDYLTNMILAPFNLNTVLYSGETLKQQNSEFAQNVLNLQSFIDLKQNAETQLNIINTAYSQLSLKANASNFPYSMTASSYAFYEFYKDGSQIETRIWYDNGPGGPVNPPVDIWTGKGEFKNAIDEKYHKVYVDYNIIYLSRLVALEVQLKSYLIQ